MTSASPLSDDLFVVNAVKRNCFLDGSLTIFDYSIKNSLLFSQGDWSLIARDLRLAGVDEQSIQALEAGPCAELLRAFRIRREIIHYKKVCLHLFEEARKIEKELKQCMSFFFWNDGDDIEEGTRAHLDALLSLCGNKANDNIPLWELDAVQIAMERHEHGDNICELVDRKIMYVVASGAWMYHTGVSKAIQDARDISKAICLSPRHPDGEANGDRPYKLEAMPMSMQVEQHLCKVEREDPHQCSRNAKQLNSKLIVKNDGHMRATATSDKKDCIAKGFVASKRVLDAVRNELHWPDRAVEFLSLSISARGGFKALAIVEELKLYSAQIRNVPSRLEASEEQYANALSSHLRNLSVDKSYKGTDEDLSTAVSQHKEIHHLQGMLKASFENEKWVQVLTSLDLEGSKTTRLFVAGDDAVHNSTCAFVPKGFQLGSFIKSSREILDKILLPTMRNVLAYEDWPPARDSRRRRISAYTVDTLKGYVGKKKLQQCIECHGYFDSRWIRYGICSICETRTRESRTEGECFFASCKAGADAFCRHYQRCFVCDAPHSCNECRLYRGDGEVVMSLVETLQPKLLLLDFDRTLCSTKSGASPLPKNALHSKTKEGYVHSIDPDLKAAVLAHQAFGCAHVVTRNPHKEDIQTFLKVHGLQTLAVHVHVVPKKVTKGSYIQEHFSLGKEEDDSILFVDDDVKELSVDPWLRTSPLVHRILFVRGFLQ